MRTIALVPARGGSKGLPQKNLKTVGGRSLVARAVDVARAVPRIDKVYVSSDDESILAAAESAGAFAVRRPPRLATDSATTIDVVRDFMSEHSDVGTLVLLQPTSPLRDALDVESCLDAMEDAATHSVATITANEHPIEWTFALGRGAQLEPVFEWGALQTRRQTLSTTYRLNGAVYVVRAEHVRANNPLVGPGTVGVAMPQSRSVDIDTEWDLALARSLHEGVSRA